MELKQNVASVAGSVLVEVEIGREVVEQDIHVINVAKREERDDLQQSISDGRV